MADLREFLGALDLRDPQTLIQSGNAVFGSASTPAKLEALLEREAARRLHLETEFFVRTAKEWEQMIADNPFPDAAREDPGHLVAMCLKTAPERDRVRALQKAITGREVVGAVGRQAYLVYPDGIGASRLTMTVIERALGTSGTGRNWNTVLKLGALAGAR